jgi:hypothetical protein
MSKFIFFFAPAIVIVLILTAISGQYQPTPKTRPISVSPTSIPTTSPAWQTYRSEKYGFEFQHPPQIYPSTIRLTDFGQDGITVASLSGDWLVSVAPVKITGSTLEQIANMKRQSFIKTCLPGYDSTPVGDMSNIFSFGLRAIGFSVAFCDKPGYNFFYYLDRGDIFYEINQFFVGNNTGINPGNSPGEFETITNLILSTFRLVDPTSTQKVKIYLPGDSDTCSSTTYKEVDIPKSSTPLKDSLEYLINSFSGQDKVEGFRLVSAVIKNNTAIITLEDPNFFTSGGSCLQGINRSQFEKTALQFPTVKKVEFIGPDYLFQP